MANRRGMGVGFDPFDPASQARRDRSLEPSVYPTGEAARATQAVAASLSAKVGALADQLAADAGAREGAAAGATDPNYTPSRSLTIRGRAADRAGVDTYLSNLSARFHADAMDLAAKHQDDPAGLKAAYEGLVGTYRNKHVFPEILGAFQTDATKLGTSLMGAALNGFEAKQKDQQRASMLSDMQTRDTAGQRLLAANPSDPATAEAYARIQAENEASIRARVAAGDISAESGERMIINLRQGAQASLIGARAGAMATANDVEAYRAQLRKDFADGKAPGVSDFGQIDGALAAIAARKRAGEDTALGQLDREIDGWLKAAGNGPENPAALVDLAAKAAALGPEAVAKVDMARRKLLAARGIGVLPPDQAASYAEKAKAAVVAPQAGDPSALRRYLTPGKDPAHADKLNTRFAGELQTMLEAMPPELKGQVKIYSGYRTVARQAELFAAAVEKYGSPAAARKHVAPPGRSNHNHGVAADLRFASDAAREWVHAHAAEYGLHFRMSHEDWHIEPIDIPGALAGKPGEPAAPAGPVGPAGGSVTSAGGAAVAEFNDFVDKAVEDHRKLVATDPLAAAERAGLFTSVTALDFGAPPADLANAVRARISEADVAARNFGQPAAAYIRPEEKLAFKAAMDKGGDTALTALAAIVDGAGPAAPEVLRQVGADAPALVHAATVARATGDLTFARQVAAAQRMRAAETPLPTPPAEAVNTAIADALGPSLSLLDPMEAGRTRAAVRDAAAGEIARLGLDPKDGAAIAPVLTAAAQAARGRTIVNGEAFGGVADVYYGSPYNERDIQVEVPPEVKAARFGAVLDAITDQDISALEDPPVDPKGRPLPAEALRRLAPMLAPGGYAFGQVDEATQSTVLTAAKSGRPFVLPWARFSPVLRSRVPDAFR